MAKLIVVMAMTAISTLVLLCGILTDGAILAQLQPEVVFAFPIPWVEIFRDGARVMGLAFLALTIQHWVSLRWRSFLVAVGAGFVAMVAGCFAVAAGQQAGGWAQYFPWALPMLVLARLEAEREHFVWIPPVVGGVAVIAGAALLVLGSRRTTP